MALLVRRSASLAPTREVLSISSSLLAVAGGQVYRSTDAGDT
jgi:hypothetical protein